MTFEEWMTRYIDRVASQARMDRSEAERIVRSAGDECYRFLFNAGEDPADSADEELQCWCE